VKRVAVLATATASGKTTFGRALADRLGVAFVELDALNHGPDWTEATPEQLRAKVAPIVATESWVIDGAYRGKLGDLVLERADTVVWIDLPLHVWLPRLIRRSLDRIIRREALWAGNRETLRNVFFRRDSLLVFALRTYRARRDRYSKELARYHLVRLRSQHDVDRFLRSVSGRARTGRGRD
jgi:adenylate kinase family enzyme